MANEHLDAIIERVKTRFLNEILELSNSECEYVCIALANHFDGQIELIRDNETRSMREGLSLSGESKG